MSDLEHEAYNMFLLLLGQRKHCSRKTSSEPLSSITFNLVGYYIISEESAYLKQLLDENISRILDDCDIFFDMSKAKALDAMRELSDLASIYCIENSPIYDRICAQIKNLIVSYPAGNI